MGPDPSEVQFRNLFAELIGLVSEFRREGLDYAVCGGLALAVYGFPRATKDIDVLVVEQSLPLIKIAAKRCGFTIAGTTMNFRSGDRLVRVVKPLLPTEDVLILDLIVVGEFNRDAWESRHNVETTVGMVCIAGLEGLKKMKRRAGRPQDLADLQRLEEIENGSTDG